jgi:hypothetical protein
VAPRIYAKFLVKNLESDNSSKKFVVSFENAVVLSLVMVLQLFGSRIERDFKMHFFNPILLMLCCDIFPLTIIMKNKKMKNELKIFLRRTLENLSFIKKQTPNLVAPF